MCFFSLYLEIAAMLVLKMHHNPENQQWRTPFLILLGCRGTTVYDSNAFKNNFPLVSVDFLKNEKKIYILTQNVFLIFFLFIYGFYLNTCLMKRFFTKLQQFFLKQM